MNVSIYHRHLVGFYSAVDKSNSANHREKHWDENHLGYDETGDEYDMPDNAHILVRWEIGNFMIVSKGTLWNGASKTYGGIHNDLSTPLICEAILKGIVDIAA